MKLRKSKYLCLRCQHIYMAWDIFCTNCGSYSARRIINRSNDKWQNTPDKKESANSDSKK